MTVPSAPPNVPRRHETRLLIKRIVDVIGAGIGLVLSVPLLIIGTIAIRLTMGPGVVFRQARPGRNGRSFTLYKLRTMTNAPEGDAPKKASDFSRVTPVGRLLRTTSIDELPQLWNVLKGDMSLVGPRPLLTKYLPYYDEVQMRRHEMKPGITGWAQIHRRTAVTWQQRLDLDVWYIDHWTPWLDVFILLCTVRDVISRDGDPAMDSLSRTADNEQEFRGNSASGLASAAGARTTASVQERS
jgi:lipopolysaccharide/colanic/teichoic acid biosynthesis glycosyltransferase